METRDKNEDLKVVDRFWPEISEQELRTVFSAYSKLGEFRKIRFQSSRPLSAACIVDTTKGSFFVKRNSISIRSKQDWEYEHRMIESLDKDLISFEIPEICKTLDGETVYQLGESLYEVQTTGIGKDIYRTAHTWSPLQSVDHAREIGRSLADLHNAIQKSGFKETRNPPYQKARFEIFYAEDPALFLESYLHRIPNFETLQGSEGFAEKVLNVYREFFTKPEEERSIPIQVTHSDPQASNFFWEDGKAVCLIDFHLANCNNYLYDLAVAVDRNCIYWLDLLAGKREAYSLEGALAILEEYARRSEEKSQTLPGKNLFFKALVLHRLEFALDLLNYYLNIEHSVFKAQWCIDVYILAHGKWFVEREGRKFLESCTF